MNCTSVLRDGGTPTKLPAIAVAAAVKSAVRETRSVSRIYVKFTGSENVENILPRHKRVGQVRHVHSIRTSDSISIQSSSENADNSASESASPAHNRSRHLSSTQVLDDDSSVLSCTPSCRQRARIAAFESARETIVDEPPNVPPASKAPQRLLTAAYRRAGMRRAIKKKATSELSDDGMALPSLVAALALSGTTSLPPSFRISTRRRLPKRSPGLPHNSSEESTSSEPIPDSSFFRDDLLTENRHSLYKTTLQLLATDKDYQREVALGKRIGFYRLGKEIGCGNFSKVKLGVHVLTKEKVAIKTMERSKMDQKAQRLLVREIANMELMHHPNIIRLFECVETLSKMYLIMEYAGNGELYNYVQQNGKLSEETAKPIFAQLVSAVTHLHAKSISHRDIKAENVIFSQPGWVKLADFGFSCKYEMGKLLNTFCGSPPYAAPELFRDEHYDGFKVDIWALGVLLYFMLVGVTPFRGETMVELKQNIITANYTIPEYVSTFAQHLLARMIEIDVGKRSSVLELRRTYWLKNNKFPDSYLQLSLNPDAKKLETNEVERQVWAILNNYGINEAMIREASDKGSRNAIIGTYRIVLYQCQAKDRDEERMRLNNHIALLSQRNRQLALQMQQNSKACTIL